MLLSVLGLWWKKDQNKVNIYRLAVGNKNRQPLWSINPSFSQIRSKLALKVRRLRYKKQTPVTHDNWLVEKQVQLSCICPTSACYMWSGEVWQWLPRRLNISLSSVQLWIHLSLPPQKVSGTDWVTPRHSSSPASTLWLHYCLQSARLGTSVFVTRQNVSVRLLVCALAGLGV